MAKILDSRQVFSRYSPSVLPLMVHLRMKRWNNVANHTLKQSLRQCPPSLCLRSHSQVQTTQSPPMKDDLPSVGRDSGCKSPALLSHISAVPADQCGTSYCHARWIYLPCLHQLASFIGHCRRCWQGSRSRQNNRGFAPVCSALHHIRRPIIRGHFERCIINLQ